MVVEPEIKKFKCPKCLNIMVAKKFQNGCYKGSCTACKSLISTKRISPKETTIKIITN